MNKTLLIFGCMLLSWQACARDVDGVQVPDKAVLEKTTLLLNGAGVRSKFFFKVYVGALYLTQKQTVAETVIADGQYHRVALFMLRDLSSDKISEAFEEGIAANLPASEIAALHEHLKLMSQIFQEVKEVKAGDVLTLDYIPAMGTRVSLNFGLRGFIPGPSFNQAVLRIWLGTHPVQESLKSELLGG